MSHPHHPGADYPGATAAQWLEGARPHTWANAFAPVFAGTAAAALTEQHDLRRAALATIVALALIIGVNYANDYSDGIRGTDEERTGPLRLTGSRLVPPRSVKIAAFLAFGVAGIAGTTLSLLSQPLLIAVGIICVAAAWFYTGGSNPYGYRGLGEVAVFVFFGLVAVLGTQFTQAGHISWTGVGFAVAVGAMSAAVNLVNNLRDIPTDSDAGKITLAVRLGDANTRRLWAALIATALLIPVIVATTGGRWWLLLPVLVSLPRFTLAARPVLSGAVERDLIPVLGMTGRGMLDWASITLAVAVLS